MVARLCCNLSFAILGAAVAGVRSGLSVHPSLLLLGLVGTGAGYLRAMSVFGGIAAAMDRDNRFMAWMAGRGRPPDRQRSATLSPGSRSVVLAISFVVALVTWLVAGLAPVLAA